MEKRDASGVKGHLLVYPDVEGNTIVAFRIYEYDDHGKVKKRGVHAVFKDYEIRHHDLKVMLLDGTLFEDDGENYIDYDLPPRKSSV